MINGISSVEERFSNRERKGIRGRFRASRNRLPRYMDTITPQKISGWSVSDNAALPTKFIFPASTTIAPGGYLTLYANTATLDATGLYLGFQLDGDGEGVFLYDGANYTMHFDGSVNAVPPGVNVDAIFLLIDDFGDLILSFDVPTTIGPSTYEPSDLVRYAGGGFNVYVGPSGVPPNIAAADDVTGADETAGFRILSMDVPSDLTPSTGPATYLPGQLADRDGVEHRHDRLHRLEVVGRGGDQQRV